MSHKVKHGTCIASSPVAWHCPENFISLSPFLALRQEKQRASQKEAKRRDDAHQEIQEKSFVKQWCNPKVL